MYTRVTSLFKEGGLSKITPPSHLGISFTKKQLLYLLRFGHFNRSFFCSVASVR